MYVEGIHMVFGLTVVKSNSKCENIGYYETAGEMQSDFFNAKSRLDDGETIEVDGCECLNGQYYMLYTVDITNYQMTIQEMERLDKELKEEVPEQMFSEIPKRKKIHVGQKTGVLSDYKYLCKHCGCDSKICHSYVGYTRFLNSDIQSGKVKEGTISCAVFGGILSTSWAVLCPNCFNTLESCECTKYPREAFPVDYALVEIISSLNKKGYFTKGCCEGHKPGQTAYIAFVIKYNIELPSGWYWDMHYHMNYSLTEEKNQFEEDKNRALEQLTEWENALAPLEGAFSDYCDPVIHKNLKALTIYKSLSLSHNDDEQDDF